jgi:hypothetical protein
LPARCDGHVAPNKKGDPAEHLLLGQTGAAQARALRAGGQGGIPPGGEALADPLDCYLGDRVGPAVDRREEIGAAGDAGVMVDDPTLCERGVARARARLTR